MLKRNALVTSLAVTAATVLLAHGNPREVVQAKVGAAEVSVEYGRPSLKGRDMLGQAAEGMVWRVGADKATTLTTTAGLSFGGHALPEGSYTLGARKDAGDTWTLLLEADGTTTEAPLATRKLDESVELFTILVSSEGKGGQLELRWGTHALTTSFAAAD
jgi:hypothetical protein